LFEDRLPDKEDDVRVTTALNRMLALPGTSVRGVALTGDGVVIEVCPRRRRMACACCGQLCGAVYDRSWRRWRHLDLGPVRCWLSYELRRVSCPDCGIRVEAVPWARRGARFTRDFEDLTALMCQQMAKTTICSLLRISWRSVGRIVERVVADHLDERRLEGLVMIGIDEISYRRNKRFLTSVADHQTGGIVWSAEGKSVRTLQGFFELLGDRKHSIRAVSIDMNGGYEKAIRAALPDAEVCFDPFHVVALAGKAVEQVRREEWNHHGRSKNRGGKWIRETRWSLLKAPDKQSPKQLAVLAEVQKYNHRLYRAFLLKEQLRLIYHLEDPDQAPELLDAWLQWASRSQLQPFLKLASTIRTYREGILAAIRLGVSNGRLEGLNSKIRLISHRSYGLHSAQALIALIYLCCTRLTIPPPHR
jgi:transposase